MTVIFLTGQQDGANEEGEVTRLEPYLALIKEKKGVAVITETKERINMPPEKVYEEEEEEEAADSQIGMNIDPAVLEHDVPFSVATMPPSPTSAPHTLLSITAKPLVPNSTTRTAHLSAQAKTAAQEASWVSERHKALPYWKRDKWESVATDVGVGTEEFSRRITAHARPPREKFDYGDTRKVLQPVPEVSKGIAPSATILEESIAVEEARRQMVTKDHDSTAKLLGLRDGHEGRALDTQLAGVPNEDFVDFVQGTKIHSLKERHPSRLISTKNRLTASFLVKSESHVTLLSVRRTTTVSLLALWTIYEPLWTRVKPAMLSQVCVLLS